MVGFGNGMTRSENFVVDYGEVIISHHQSVGRVISVITVREIAITFFINITVARYK